MTLAKRSLAQELKKLTVVTHQVSDANKLKKSVRAPIELGKEVGRSDGDVVTCLAPKKRGKTIASRQ
jgi:hypothetical protein